MDAIRTFVALPIEAPVAEAVGRLLPKMRAELRPASRVVSYQFGIGDWTPAGMEGIWIGELRSEIFLFKVPPR